MKFSVIMPAYNCEKYISQAIESVICQSFDDFELIIVNDGSTDSTYDICLNKADKDSRISCYTLNHNGVSNARNFGISKASGKYILFIDCDDFWQKDLLKVLNNNLKENDELIVFGIKANYFTSDDTLSFTSDELKQGKQPLTIQLDNNINSIFGNYNFSSPCNKVYKKQLICRNNILFDTDCVYLEDLKFNLDYMQHINTAKIVFDNLYNYRLFVDKKQIFKRAFKKPYVNADKLFISIKSFVDKKSIELSNADVLLGISMTAFISEYICSDIKDISLLNKNDNFNCLLKNIKGKFFTVLRLLKILRLTFLEKALIERRYKNAK